MTALNRATRTWRDRLRDHLGEVIIGALLALAGWLGAHQVEKLEKSIEENKKEFLKSIADTKTQLLKSIDDNKKDVQKFECSAGVFLADLQRHELEAQLIGEPLDAMTSNDSLAKDLPRIITTFEQYLSTGCDEGRRTLAGLQSFRDGAQAYRQRRYADAIASFQKMDSTSLSEQFRGSALMHLYDASSNSEERQKLEQQAQQAFSSAAQLAQSERD